MDYSKLDASCSACGTKVTEETVCKKTSKPWPGTDGGFMVHHNCPGQEFGGSLIVWEQKDGIWRKDRKNRKRKGD